MGDRTSHGGTVVSADFTTDINGRYMARVGDLVVCPKCKGVFRINSGAQDMVDGEGRAYAREMDTTECGAKLISSQSLVTWSNVSSLGSPVAGTETYALSAAPQVATPATSGICLDCLRKAAYVGSSSVIRE